MKIGEFTKETGSTKDTVRHYQQLGLLCPESNGAHHMFTEKDVMDYQAIIEMKSYGLNLKDIQLIFECKKTLGCGSERLFQEVLNQLDGHLESILEEENQLKKRRVSLESTIKEIRELADEVQ